MCHTGLVWTRSIGGRELHFHLAGINNQNFLMRDEETGSYWQQVTGTAISGSLKGARLSLVPQDELTFALWKKEQPGGTVLASLPRDASKYEKATWESEVGKLPTVIHAPKGSLPDRETIIGVVEGGIAKAYPLARLTSQSPVLLDVVGGKSIMVVLGPDGRSVRVFSRELDDQTLEFFGNDAPWTLLDEQANTWGFDGCALTGEAKGRCLARVDYLKDYWFDWQHYHPETGIFRH